MPRIPSREQLGEPPALRPPRAVLDYGGIGAGVDRTAALAQREADRTGTALVQSGGGLQKFAMELADAEARIQSRHDAVLLAKDYGAFSERAQTELRRLTTEEDLSLPDTAEKYGQWLASEQERTIGAHRGSEGSRQRLSARVEAGASAFRGQIAAMALEAQDKAVTDHMGSRINGLTTRAYSKPGSLVELFRGLDAEIDDLAPALRPDQERAFRRAGRERIAEAALGGLIARGAMPEAEKLMATPGLSEILGDQAQARIHGKLFEAQRAIADAETAGLRKRAELGALLGRQPSEDELRAYAGLAPKTDKLTELRTLLGREPTAEERQIAAGITPKQEDMVKVLTPEGGVKYVPKSQAAGQPAPDEAMVVMGPEGKPIFMRGGVGALTSLQTGMTQAAQNKVNEDLLAATNNRMLTLDIERRFKPEYQEIPTKLGMEWTALKEKGGGILGKSTPEQKARLDDFSQYRASAAQQFALTLKEMSGVAVNPTEFKRAEAWLPNPGTGVFDGDSPTELQAKVKRFRDFQDKAIARLAYTAKSGLKFDSVSLDDMPRIVRERGAEIDRQLAETMTDPALRARAVKAQIAKEFGLVAVE